MILAVIACLSLSSLSFELLITRFFSIAQWGHLSFVAVGVAVFGCAAGGTLHNLIRERRTPSLFPVLSLPGSVSTVAAFLAVKALPLDYLRFPVETAQALYLLLTWLLLSLPFVVCGLASVAAYSSRPGQSGAISCASLLGSAAGALAPALLLPLVEEGGCVAVSALVPLFPVLAFSASRAPKLSALALSVFLGAFFLWQHDGVLSVEPSPYKTLPLLRQAPGTKVTSREPGLRGRLEEAESPIIRFAPGLSLSYADELPRQRGLIVDGDSMTALYDLSGPGAVRFARWTHAFAPYILWQETGGRRPDCLVLQQDGGLALACALASGPRRVVLVVEDPRIARREAEWYFGQPLSMIAENPRSYIARHGARYSTIAIDDWGPSIPGMASLQTDSLLTVNAIAACWRRLEDNGVLAISRRLVLPPSDSLRLFSAVLGALAREGAEDPASHIAVVRSWDSCTILASRAPLRGGALERLLSFAGSRSFDLDYYPGVTPSETNRFSRYDRPVFADAYVAIARDPGFPARQSLDVAAQDDDRPFPSHFVRWLRMGDFLRATGGRLYTVLLTGEVIAGAVLLEVAALAAALLLMLFLLRGPRTSGGRRGNPRLLLLVGMGGIGFMGTEMFVINSLSPLFPSPSVALSIALGGLLFFSALGGLVSERLTARALGPVLVSTAIASAVFCLVIPAAFSWVLPLSFPARVAAAVGLMALPGFLIGMPFPAAMRILPTGSRQRAEAWAVNGCASVFVSAASALIAPAAGIRMLLVTAAVAYVFAAGAALRIDR